MSKMHLPGRKSLLKSRHCIVGENRLHFFRKKNIKFIRNENVHALLECCFTGKSMCLLMKTLIKQGKLLIYTEQRRFNNLAFEYMI